MIKNDHDDPAEASSVDLNSSAACVDKTNGFPAKETDSAFRLANASRDLIIEPTTLLRDIRCGRFPGLHLNDQAKVADDDQAIPDLTGP
jgi:hypothetical protein